MCNRLGQFYENRRELHKSLEFYNEASNQAPKDVKIMLNMARLHLLMGDLDECFRICNYVLRLDSDNDTATLVKNKL